MSFQHFARECGLEVVDSSPSRRIRRCGTITHPRSKNGAYLWDGERGWAFAWDGDGQPHWYGEARQWTDEDKRQWARDREAERALQAKRHQDAARKAQALIAQASLSTHGYLRLKGFPETQALVLPDETLLVPMRDYSSNELRGVQSIRWLPEDRRWEKKMLAGMRAKGAVLRLGPRQARETILCEGFATGLSIEAAVKWLRLSAAVLVCFSDTNLVTVAPMVKGPAYVYADHDASGAGQRAAEATGLPWCKPDVEGWDANDLHTERGLLAVCRQLMEVKNSRTPHDSKG